MKAAVYFFSGTGNSFAVARDIAKELNGDLIKVSSVVDQGGITTDANLLVIVFPVYVWGMPLIIERFVKQIQNIGNKRIYAIVTCGGMPGGTIKVLEKTIRGCGGKLAAGFSVLMPGNYTPMYEAIPEAKQQKMFANWQDRLSFIAEYIKSNREGIKEQSNPLVNLLFTSLIYKVGAKHIPEMAKQFWVDDQCSKCGICQKVCPVNNIAMIDGKPTWQNRCEQCFACLQWCPEKAIQSGKNTATRKRYHHPDLKLSDMMK